MRNRDDRSDLVQNCLSHSSCRCNIGAHARQNSCLQAVRQFTFHCKFPQLQHLHPRRRAKDREGLCLPAAVFRVSSRLFADRRLSPLANPWPPAPRPCSSGRSGLVGPPLCGGGAPRNAPSPTPPAAPSEWQYDLVDPLRPNFSPHPASWLVPNAIQRRQRNARPRPTHTPPIPRRATPRVRPGPHPQNAPNLPRSP